MFVSAASEDEQGKQRQEQPLPPLSEQLDLDILWDTLSQCLTELQHTQDNHAVLVLQVHNPPPPARSLV